jgi:hypothetical protein
MYGQKPNDIPILKEAIVSACVHFDHEFCQEVCRSLLERARACVAAGEDYDIINDITNYVFNDIC